MRRIKDEFTVYRRQQCIEARIAKVKREYKLITLNSSVSTSFARVRANWLSETVTYPNAYQHAQLINALYARHVEDIQSLALDQQLTVRHQRWVDNVMEELAAVGLESEYLERYKAAWIKEVQRRKGVLLVPPGGSDSMIDAMNDWLHTVSHDEQPFATEWRKLIDEPAQRDYEKWVRETPREDLERQAQEWAWGYETGEQLLQRILTERRQSWSGKGKYKEPSRPAPVSDFEIPDGWSMACVDQIGAVGTGATPKRGTTRFYEGGTIPWVTSGALNDIYVETSKEFVTDTAIRQTNLSLYPPGTLLVAMYGEGKTRGKCSELRIFATTNQAIAAIEVSEKLRPYTKVCLQGQYEKIRLAASGGVQPNLNLSLVREIQIPLPPLAEQVRIVAEVERRLSVADQLEATLTANLHRATRLRQAILKKAFAYSSGNE